MSSFIVSHKTINNIVSYLAGASDNLEHFHIKDFIEKFKDAHKDGFFEKLGRKLLKMNVDAVNQRYGQAKDSKATARSYKWELVQVTPVQAYKSLNCLLYQCSEGNIPNRKLFKQFEKFVNSLAHHIVHNLDEWKNGGWE